MNIAIVGSGDMGSAVAKSLIGSGHNVLTCLEGRSKRSRKLAQDAGMREEESLAAMLAEADVFLSIIPPASAVEFGEEVCGLIGESSRDTLFVDCNAVSPVTVSGIAAIAARQGVRFQDAGIIGAAPRPGRMPVRFYTSGEWTDEMQQLATDLVEIRPLGNEIGRASAIKMVYASLTKGTNALRAAAAMAGERLGIGDEIRAEWQQSLPDVYKAMQVRMPNIASDSGRWTGEMREIAGTYQSIGLTPAFHEGAEWIYELLSETTLADESRDEANASGRSIEDAIGKFLKALDQR